MDAAETASFKKSIDGAISSDSGDFMFKDVMLTYLKNNKSEFTNLTILNELLPSIFPLLIVHKPFNKNPVRVAPDQSSFFDDYSPRRKPAKKLSNNSECEGSPLKLQSYADFSAFEPFDCTTPKFDVVIDPEELRFGIPLSLARKLTAIFNHLFKKNTVYPEAFLCFCDGMDRKRTACIFTQSLSSDLKEYLGVKSSIVYVTDPVPNNGHLPNLQKVDLSRKQVVCRASYDILNDTKEESLLESREYRYKGSLMLDVSWTRLQTNLNFLHMPPPEATTTIKAMVIPGSLKSSAAYPLFQELSVLKNLIEGNGIYLYRNYLCNMHYKQLDWFF